MSAHMHTKQFIRFCAISVKIPRKIIRTPTAILEELSRTVKVDDTSYNSEFIDDPRLFPNNHFLAEQVVKASKSGEYAARFAIHQMPEEFSVNPSEPAISAYQPPLYTASTDEDLNAALKFKDAKTCLKIFDDWSIKGHTIDRDILEKVFELVAFYGNKGPHNFEIKKLQNLNNLQDVSSSTSQLESESTGDHPCIRIFNALPEKSQRNISILLKALIKNGDFQQAKKYMEEFQHQYRIDEVTARRIFPLITRRLTEKSFQNIFDFIDEFLRLLHSYKCQPTVHLFSSILRSIHISFPASLEYSKKVFGEMVHLNIKPNLAIFASMLRIHSKKFCPNLLVYDIISYIEERGINDFPLEEEEWDSSTFFAEAMFHANQLKDFSLGCRIYDLLEQSRFKFEPNDIPNRQQLYMNYFYVLFAHNNSLDTEAQVENIWNRFQKIYMKKFYPPNFAIRQNVFPFIVRQNVFHWLEYLHDVFVPFNVWNSSQVFFIAYLDCMSKAPEHINLSTHVKEMLSLLETQHTQKVVLSKPVVSHAVKIFIKAGEIEEAYKLFQTSAKRKVVADENVIEVLFNELIACSKKDEAMQLVKTADKCNMLCLTTVATKLLDSFKDSLSEKEIEFIQDII